MSLLRFLGEFLRNVVESDLERLRRTIREEREAKIARGEAPPRFRSYDDYLQSEWWKRLRGHVLSHLSFECEFCTGRATQVHHVRYPRTSDLGSENIKSLYAVCSRCHDIAHGQNANNTDSKCAFCRRVAAVNLTIEIQKYSRSTQRVCSRCHSLANGYRGQANKWAKRSYEEWVERWRQTIPSLHGASLTPDVAQKDHRDDGRDHDTAVLAASARRHMLNEREREFSALSTEELRIQWDSQEHSEYEEDELDLLRSMIRQRLGYQK